MVKNKRLSSNRRRRTNQLNLKGWLRHHGECAKESITGLIRQPISSALTWLVIAIALLLPTLFYLALKAVNEQTRSWQEGGQITLYLLQDVDRETGLALAAEIANRPEVLRTEFTSRQQAWQDFQNALSLQQDLQLDDNPLMASITLVPKQQSQADLEAMILLLQDMPEVEDLQIDLAWISRLNSVLDLLRAAVQLLAFILAGALLLIVSNTIRLAIASRKAEIQTIKLLGATDAFVRRPFLYLGFWYGVLGGLAAWLLLTLISIYFQPVLTNFLSNYGLSAPSTWLNVKELAVLLVSSVLVSLLGARIALWRHLRDSDPH